MARLFASPYAVVAVIAIVVVLLPLAVPGGFYMRVAALVYINAIAVIGLNLLMGYAGQVSLGHADFSVSAPIRSVWARPFLGFRSGSRSLPARCCPGFWRSSSAGRSCGCAGITSRWRRSASAC